MFLALIIVIYMGLSVRETSMTGMTQIEGQVIIIRKNKKYYASPNKIKKKFPNLYSCRLRPNNVYRCFFFVFLFNEAQNVTQHIYIGLTYQSVHTSSQ